MIIGITGSFGAGKGAVADYLIETKDFAHYSAREYIFQQAEKRGLSRDGGREVLIPVANDLRAKGGPAFIADALYEQAQAKGGDAILESFRAVAEVKRLQELGGVVIGVDADPKIRYERTVKRGSETDHVTFDEWREHEIRESNPDDPTKQDIFGALKASDFILNNNGSLEDLHSQVNDFLKLYEPRVIAKSGWFCIENRKVLFARSNNNPDIFYVPGGKRKEGESDEEALIREIKEETTIDLDPTTIKYQDTFSFHAHGKPTNVTVELKAYAADYAGDLTPSDEISELVWLNSSDLDKVYGVGKLSIEWLKEKNLID